MMEMKRDLRSIILGGLIPVLLAVLTVFSVSSCSEVDPDPGPPPVETGTFVRVQEDRVVTRDDLAAEISELVPIIKPFKPILASLIGVDVHLTDIVYTTSAPDGGVIEASGIVAYPEGLKSYDHILSIQHGTCDIADAPTKVFFPAELAPVVTENAVVVMADYIGYGVSETPDLQHPYLHKKLTGSTCADMIQAAEQYLSRKEKGVPWSNGDGIKLIGYSQGGAATVAAMLELERRGEQDRILEARAGAGPYDLPGFFDVLCAKECYSMSGYIAFVLRGLVFGDGLEVNPSKVYAPEVISSGCYSKFSTTQLSKWHSMLGGDIHKIIHPDFFVVPGYNGNREVQAIMASMEANSILTSSAPSCVSKLHLYHSPTDDTVPYFCSEELSEKWGCALTDLEVRNNHLNAGIEFILRYMGLWEKLFTIFL